jgi:hypothetical protein
MEKGIDQLPAEQIWNSDSEHAGFNQNDDGRESHEALRARRK